MNDDRVVLKPGKEKPIKQRHHWIFSGAIEQLPKKPPGTCLQVYDAKGKHLGWGYFNNHTSLAGRMISFDETAPHEAIKRHLELALKLRKAVTDPYKTTAYRLVNGEGDLLPGLIIDIYGDIAVVQISTWGMHRMRENIVSWLKEHIQPLQCIYEKSTAPSRREEGNGFTAQEEGVLSGELPDGGTVIVKENGLNFEVSVTEGQKTGFFLDHREMREQIQKISEGKKVLNCFGYTGGFSVYAAAGGALGVDTVDISEEAVKVAKKNMQLNGFGEVEGNEGAFKYICEDVFTFLRNLPDPMPYDVVVLDPPAFAKRKKDVIQACRGYKDINRIAMQKMAKGKGIFLLTSSCSYFVDEELFQKVVFQAALEAGRQAKIIGRHRLALDHPINLYHPECEYLKSLLLYVE